MSKTHFFVGVCKSSWVSTTCRLQNPQEKCHLLEPYIFLGCVFFVLLLNFFFSSVCASIHIELPLGKIVSVQRRSPCIDIFNNSFYYASIQRATACLTASNSHPEQRSREQKKMKLVFSCQNFSCSNFTLSSISFFVVCSVRSQFKRKKYFLFNLIHVCIHQMQGLKRSVTTLRGGSLGYAEIVAVKV